MSQSIVAQLVLKDLRLASPLVAGTLVLGVLSLAVSPWSAVAFFVGGSVLIVALILLNIMLVTASLMSERKEKTRVFMLSMPVSTTAVLSSKLLSSLIAYLVPAALLTIGGVLLLPRDSAAERVHSAIRRDVRSLPLLFLRVPSRSGRDGLAGAGSPP